MEDKAHNLMTILDSNCLPSSRCKGIIFIYSCPDTIHHKEVLFSKGSHFPPLSLSSGVKTPQRLRVECEGLKDDLVVDDKQVDRWKNIKQALDCI